MKKILIIMAVFVSAAAWADPGEKILRSFHESFPNADTVSWYENAKGYEACFTSRNIKCRIWYDNEGNVIKCIRYYGAENLHPFIIARVKMRYPALKIYGVTEESSEDGLQYHLTLEDDKRWYNVTGDYLGNFSLDKKFRKAPQE
ncbi:MAG TPA: hypothetical protein VNR87_08050 [Flavisolibacter sp.]|nr:hypothetical protein [Flavisolibacter sp.]